VEPDTNTDPVVESGPLTVGQLSAVLLAAAEVAAGDQNHDLITTLDVLNKDVLRPAGLPLVYEGELRQIAAALLERIPSAERDDLPRGEVAAVNAWLAHRRRLQRHLAAHGGNLLADLLSTAAGSAKEDRSPEPKPGY
jgi:hypothetical protein